MQFGEKIRLLRKRAGISQKDFAEQLGITRRALVYYENGERFPREAELIDKIAGFFNVSSDFLTDDSESIAMTKEELFLEEAKAEDKLRGKSEAKKFIETTKCLFAGGELSEEDKDALFEVLTEMNIPLLETSESGGRCQSLRTAVPVVPVRNHLDYSLMP